jgi:hypothetical protein
MYGVDASQEGAQEYYDSIFELYASWGVDYVKVDDLARVDVGPDAPGAGFSEITLIKNAIEKCGRPMVLSLSPGPARVDQKDFLLENANMWRMTDDFWDKWELLYGMFERAEAWQGIGCKDHWPDCDMLPLGHIAVRTTPDRHDDRMTNFTQDEQRLLMTLWCIFRSPLMFGGELRDNDPFTLSLLTNKKLLEMHRDGRKARQISRKKDIVTWMSKTKEGKKYLAIFNLNDEVKETKLKFENYGFDKDEKVKCTEIWSGREGSLENGDKIALNPHGCMCFEIEA